MASDCVLEPMAGRLNDYRKVSMASAADDDGEESDSDDEGDALELQEMTDELVADVEMGDNLLIDAANDTRAAGAKVGGQQLRYYHARAFGPPYEIEAEIEGNDYELEPGDFAIDVEYSFLVNAPATTPRRYHDRAANPCVVTVPTHLVLHARFEMATVDVGRSASSALKQAAQLGTVVELAEQDHEAAMEELKRRTE